jgi:hypothetical protein
MCGGFACAVRQTSGRLNQFCRKFTHDPFGPDPVAGAWEQLADHERFFASEGHGAKQPVEPELFVPALGCALWLRNE